MAFHYKQCRHIQQCDVSDDQHSALVFDDKVIKFTCIWKAIWLFTSVVYKHIAWFLKLRSANCVTNCKIGFIRVSNWQNIVLLFASTLDIHIKKINKSGLPVTQKWIHMFEYFSLGTVMYISGFFFIKIDFQLLNTCIYEISELIKGKHWNEIKTV